MVSGALGSCMVMPLPGASSAQWGFRSTGRSSFNQISFIPQKREAIWAPGTTLPSSSGAQQLIVGGPGGGVGGGESALERNNQAGRSLYV